MNKLKKSVTLETAFERYVAREILGEGGCGRVFGGESEEGRPVAIKVLYAGSTDKRRRFKNETAFLAKNTHKNIATVIDQGIAAGEIAGPFYVLERYDGSVRSLLRKKLKAEDVLPLFGQILDGVEAAHLLGVVHRDLKPENILVRGSDVAVADFGTASFTEEFLHTKVETQPTQRLANFQYAAPEQRVEGKVDRAADIFALGLMLNEMFTGVVPGGTEFETIAATSPDFGFLDPIVARMIKQRPAERPQTVEEVKRLIQIHHTEAISLQKLSEISRTVIPQGEVDEPLAHDPPQLLSVDWKYGTLELILDRPVNDRWIVALHNMRDYSSVYRRGPHHFQFNGNVARVAAREEDVQTLVDHFKPWLPAATKALKVQLEKEARMAEDERQKRLQIERQHEEARLRILQKIRL